MTTCQQCGECFEPKRPHARFCSDRCRSSDLSRWLNGSYAIPVAEDETKADYSDEE